MFYRVFWRYPMVILWLCYGYPMVKGAYSPVDGCEWGASVLLFYIMYNM